MSLTCLNSFGFLCSGMLKDGPCLKKKKSFMFKTIIAGIGIFLMLSSCQKSNPAFNKTDEKLIVENAIRSCIGWAKTKDIDLLYSVIANDSSYLEVSPEGRVTKGFQEFRKNEKFWMNPDFKAIRYDIKDLVINFSESGDVAWFYCILDDINEWKGQPASWENTRWTGVLEKREGKWIVVQMHFSFASN